MRSLISRIGTTVAYDGVAGVDANDDRSSTVTINGQPAVIKPLDRDLHRVLSQAQHMRRVTIKPGLNVVDDNQFKVLESDQHFVDHVNGGHITVLDVEDADDGKPMTDGTRPANDRERLKGETQKAYEARMKGLDESMFLADYDAMNPADQAAYFSALTDDQKALINARK